METTPQVIFIGFMTSVIVLFMGIIGFIILEMIRKKIEKTRSEK